MPHIFTTFKTHPLPRWLLFWWSKFQSTIACRGNEVDPRGKRQPCIEGMLSESMRFDGHLIDPGLTVFPRLPDHWLLRFQLLFHTPQFLSTSLCVSYRFVFEVIRRTQWSYPVRKHLLKVARTNRDRDCSMNQPNKTTQRTYLLSVGSEYWCVLAGIFWLSTCCSFCAEGETLAVDRGIETGNSIVLVWVKCLRPAENRISVEW